MQVLVKYSFRAWVLCSSWPVRHACNRRAVVSSNAPADRPWHKKRGDKGSVSSSNAGGSRTDRGAPKNASAAVGKKEHEEERLTRKIETLKGISKEFGGLDAPYDLFVYNTLTLKKISNCF